MTFIDTDDSIKVLLVYYSSEKKYIEGIMSCKDFKKAAHLQNATCSILKMMGKTIVQSQRVGLNCLILEYMHFNVIISCFNPPCCLCCEDT